MAQHVALAVALGLTSFASLGEAYAGGLELDEWLHRPGVQLVAVELYATWCKPCMEAVPRWKALHEKYRDQGLRLVVVSTRDPGGQCSSPPWTPDAIVCDDEGAIADALGAQQLPAAFLWSWDGRRLATKADVGAVEGEIERWLKARPRVAVEVEALPKDAGMEARELQDNLRTQLVDDESFQVVATASERAALDQLIKESLSAKYDEKLACELGQAVPANTLLKARVAGQGKGRQLHLLLLSAERGCLVANASVPWRSRDPALSVAEAAFLLTERLRRPAELPGGQSLPAAPDHDGDGVSDERDRCADAAEAWNGFKDDDGCADSTYVSLLGRYAVDFPAPRFQPNSPRLDGPQRGLIEPLRRLYAKNRSITLEIACTTPGSAGLANERQKALQARLVAAGLDAGRIALGNAQVGPEACGLYTGR